MPSTAIDSQIHGSMFSTDEMREIFSDKSWAQKWLDTEAALAKAQGELGVIPKEKAEQKEEYEQMDLFSYQQSINEQAGAGNGSAEEESKKREEGLQQAVLDIKRKYGKNAIVRGMNLEEGATAMERNRQVGGHRA